MNVTVLSDGSWGTALSMLLCQNGHNVTMWGPFPEYLDKMTASRENTQFLPGFKLHKNLHLEKDMRTAVADSELILLASPTQYTRLVLEQFKEFHNKDKH
ncbi:MAG: hypothetical protein KAS17_05740, partial [Victivallaceae bacterium]|nr:hypothetical protein [Victivallaceae bacterium]